MPNANCFIFVVILSKWLGKSVFCLLNNHVYICNQTNTQGCTKVGAATSLLLPIIKGLSILCSILP